MSEEKDALEVQERQAAALEEIAKSLKHLTEAINRIMVQVTNIAAKMK